MTLWRRKLKESDPERYNEYLKKQKERNLQNRASLKYALETHPTAEAKRKLTKIRAQARERNRRYREKKKQSENQQLSCKPKRPKPKGTTKTRKEILTNKKKTKKETLKVKWSLHTRSGQHEKRKYFREKKQESRENRSHQKKRRDREKDAKYKRMKRAQKRSRNTDLDTGETPPIPGPSVQYTEVSSSSSQFPSTSFPSRKTLYNITSSARKALPRSPRKHAMAVRNIIMNATPRKRKAFEDIGITPKRLCPDESQDILKETVANIKEHREKRKLQNALVSTAQKLTNKASDRAISRSLQVNRKMTSRIRKYGLTRIAHKNKLSNEHKKVVKDFFQRDDISRQLPDKRYATKHGAARVMQLTLKGAYTLFKKQHPGIKIGFTMFTVCRPPNVRLLNTISHKDVCMCPYCLNVSYKVQALNRVVTTSGKSPDMKIQDEREFVDKLLCQIQEGETFHRLDCVAMKCTKCSSYSTRIQEHYKELDKTGMCTWLRWERKECKDGKWRRVLVSKQSTLQEAISELIKDVVEPVKGTTFPHHLFTANWQYAQYRNLKENLPDTWALLIMDFGQNRTVTYQDEIKAAHYTKCQMTIHPVVSFYKNSSGERVRESLIYLSDDNTHDHSAVDHFTRLAVKYLKQVSPSLEYFVIYSDGCASQYKGRNTFADLTFSDVPMERNYYGSEHGKGEGDGEVGCINKSVDYAILGRQVIINNAQDLYTWCKDSPLCLDNPTSKRRFFYVGENEIDRKTVDVAPVPGTRKLHQVMTTGQYQLMVRNLSCFCSSCMRKDFVHCENVSIVGSVVSKKLRLVKQNVRDVADISQTPPAGNIQPPPGSAGPDTEDTSDSLPQQVQAVSSSEPSSQNDSENSSQVITSSCSSSESEIPDRRSIAIESLHVGDFVAATYEQKWYLGKIEKIDMTDHEVEVSFMQEYKNRVTGAKTFKWPLLPDQIWLRTDDIICRTQEPNPIGRNRRAFTLLDDQLKTIEDNFHYDTV